MKQYLAFLFTIAISILDISGDPGHVYICADEGAQKVCIKVDQEHLDTHPEAIDALAEFLKTRLAK